MIFKKRFLSLSQLRRDIPPIFSMVKLFVMSSAKFINKQHDPIKKATVVLKLNSAVKRPACTPNVATKNPDGVFQLNGNLRNLVK